MLGWLSCAGCFRRHRRPVRRIHAVPITWAAIVDHPVPLNLTQPPACCDPGGSPCAEKRPVYCMEMGYAQYPRWKNAGTALMLITLELAERTARLLQQMAERTGRPADAIARELIDRGVAEAPIEVLPDDEVMALAEMAMSDADQQALADLLDDQREGELDGAGRERLAALMQVYRRGMVRKSEALKAAVLRGLLPPLG